MNRRNRYLFIVLALQGAAMSGCADAPEKAAKEERGLKPIKVSRDIKTFKGADLPALGVEQPPLDDGRLTVREPEHWERMPRAADHLIGFYLTSASLYPSIRVFGGDSDWTEPVSEENLYEFARNARTELKQRVNRPKRAIIGDLQPVVISETFFGAHYVLRAVSKSGPIERLFLVTVVNGRRYTVVLQALKGTLENFRPHALAVAAGLEFHDVEIPVESVEDGRP